MKQLPATDILLQKSNAEYQVCYVNSIVVYGNAMYWRARHEIGSVYMAFLTIDISGQLICMRIAFD